MTSFSASGLLQECQVAQGLQDETQLISVSQLDSGERAVGGELERLGMG